MLSSNYVEKFVKKPHTKVRKLSHTVIKVKKSIFLSLFYRYLFMHEFSTDSKSASNSTFFNTHILFLNAKIFGGVMWPLFTNFEAQNNGKTFFYKCVLELNFGTINGLGKEPSC
jgi:hypothetical protein